MTVLSRSSALHPNLKLGFLSPHNPFDRQAFSGTSYFAAKALGKVPDVDLHVLGPHRPPRLLDRLRRVAPAFTFDQAQIQGLDAVIGLAASPQLNAFQEMHPDLPVIHVTDATPQYLREAYGWAVPKTADNIEAQVTARALVTVYSSPEISKRAPVDLNLPRLSPMSIPFGVNLEDLPQKCPEKPPLETLRLVFVGLDWVRKGGDIAVATLDWLRASGRNATLTIIGKAPRELADHPGINLVGLLDKNRPRQEARLHEIYDQSHLLVLPSRADCAPMVIAEAMAHGTPVIASDTGGIRSMIGGSGCGCLMPQFASPASWAGAIAELTHTPDAYRLLSDACFDRAQSTLNWDSWASNVITTLRQRTAIRLVA